MSAEKMVEGDAKIVRALEANDFDAAWALLGRWMGPAGRRSLYAFLTAELERRSVEELATLYRTQRDQTQGRLIRDLLGEWMADAQRSKHARAVLVRVGAEHPRDLAIRQLRVVHDLASLDELREHVLSGSGLPDPLVFALVRRGEVPWLLEQARTGRLPQRARTALAEALARRGADPQPLIAQALELGDATLLASVLDQFDVEPAVLVDALRRPEASVHAAAMRHAHRLPDPLSVLRGGLRHADAAVRRAALRKLLEQPDPAALPDVRALSDDPDPYDERYNTEPVGELARDFLRRFGE